MLTLNDSIEKDILALLLHTQQNRLQRHKIKQQLKPQYEGLGKKYAEGSFDPVLQRKLNRLCALGILRKKYEARSAFYFIVDKAKDEVKLSVEKHETKKKIDQMTSHEFQKINSVLEAAFTALRKRKLMEIPSERKLTLEGLDREVFKEVKKEEMRPKLTVGNLYSEKKKVQNKKGS